MDFPSICYRDPPRSHSPKFCSIEYTEFSFSRGDFRGCLHTSVHILQRRPGRQGVQCASSPLFLKWTETLAGIADLPAKIHPARRRSSHSSARTLKAKQTRQLFKWIPPLQI